MNEPFDIGTFVFKLPEEQYKYDRTKKWINDNHIEWDEDFYIHREINGVLHGDVNVYIVLDMDCWPLWYYRKNPFG